MKYDRTLWIIGCCIVALALFIGHWQAIYDFDEIEHIHAAWLVGTGSKPYIDFFEHHHPTLWYLIAPITLLFNDPSSLIYFIRVISIGGMLVFALIFERLARLIFPDSSSKWIALLVISLFMFNNNFVNIRPDPIMTLFLLISFYFWVRFIIHGSLKYSIISGIAAGLAFVFLQKAVIVIFIIVASLVPLLILHRKDKDRIFLLIKGTAIFIVSCLIPISIFVIALISTGLWQEFYFWNYPYNAFFFSIADVNDPCSLFRPIYRSFLQSPFLWIAGISGFVMIAKDLFVNKRKYNSDSMIIILWSIVLYIVAMSFIRFIRAQYLLFFFPLLGLVAARFFTISSSDRFKIFTRIMILGMVVEFAVVMFFVSSKSKQEKIHDIVLSKTSLDDFVAISPPYHPILRKDAAYFWFAGEKMGVVYKQYCKKFICKNNFLKIDDNRWQENPAKTVWVDPKKPDTYIYNWDKYVSRYEPLGIDRRLWFRKGQ